MKLREGSELWKVTSMVVEVGFKLRSGGHFPKGVSHPGGPTSTQRKGEAVPLCPSSLERLLSLQLVISVGRGLPEKSMLPALAEKFKVQIKPPASQHLSFSFPPHDLSFLSSSLQRSPSPLGLAIVELPWQTGRASQGRGRLVSVDLGFLVH